MEIIYTKANVIWIFFLHSIITYVCVGMDMKNEITKIANKNIK